METFDKFWTLGSVVFLICYIQPSYSLSLSLWIYIHIYLWSNHPYARKHQSLCRSFNIMEFKCVGPARGCKRLDAVASTPPMSKGIFCGRWSRRTLHRHDHVANIFTDITFQSPPNEDRFKKQFLILFGWLFVSCSLTLFPCLVCKYKYVFK